MSTDLYGVRVLATTPAELKVTFRVFVVYYDTSNNFNSHAPLPQNASFFLRILRDAVPYGEPVPGIENEQLYDEAWVNHNAYRFVGQVRQLSTRNFPLTDYTGYFDFYYGDGPWRDEEKLVQADYEVTYRDARYLDYLEPGQSWGTTSYETDSVQLTQTEAPALPRLTEEPVQLEPFEGEQEDGTPDVFVFSADSRLLVTQSQAGELVAYETGNWDEVWRAPSASGLFPYLNSSRAAGVVWQQKFQGFAGSGSVVAAYDQASGKPSDWRPAVTTARLMSPDGTHFVVYAEEDQLTFVDEQGQESWSIEQPGVVEAVSFSHDDQLVAIGGMYNEVSVWNLATRTAVQTIATADRTNALALDPSNTYLAACYFHELEIYHLGRGEKVLSYTSPYDYLGPVAWSPDGRHFALNYVGGDHGYGGYVAVFPVGDAAATPAA